jgi:hypothetical protein
MIRKMMAAVLFASLVGVAGVYASPCNPDLNNDGVGDCGVCNDPANTSGQGCLEESNTGSCAGGNAATGTGCVCIAGNCTSMPSGDCSADASAGCAQ